MEKLVVAPLATLKKIDRYLIPKLKDIKTKKNKIKKFNGLCNIFLLLNNLTNNIGFITAIINALKDLAKSIEFNTDKKLKKIQINIKTPKNFKTLVFELTVLKTVEAINKIKVFTYSKKTLSNDISLYPSKVLYSGKITYCINDEKENSNPKRIKNTFMFLLNKLFITNNKNKE